MGLPMDADPALQFFNLVSSLILNFCIDHLFVFAGEITGSLLVLGQYFSGLYNNQNPKGLVGKQVLYSQVSPWYLRRLSPTLEQEGMLPGPELLSFAVFGDLQALLGAYFKVEFFLEKVFFCM